MSDDWGSPAESDFFKPKDYVNCLVAFAVNEYVAELATSFGTGPAIRAEAVILDGPNAGKRYEEALIFNKKLIPQLRPRVGGAPVLGRLVQGKANPGQSAPYELAEASDEDKALATRYVQARGPIRSPKAPAPQNDGIQWASERANTATLPPPPAYPGVKPHDDEPPF